MVLPIKIQNIQIAALSADKNFQSVRHLPDITQRKFEIEVQRHIEEAQEQTQKTSESEKSRIHEEERKEQKERQQTAPQNAPKQGKQKSDSSGRNFIEKSSNGKIKHLDVKI